MRTVSTVVAIAALSALLAGCRIDLAEEAAPEGYHRMPSGEVMANVVMETEYRDIMGNGVILPTYTTPDGTVQLGSVPDHANGEHGGHDHPVADPADFAQGVIPVGLRLPRLDVTAPVVPTSMTVGQIEGPPVASDVGWLSQTRRPGEVGPAIFGGVREIDGEPGAFADIETLVPGDDFIVVGEDGALLAYRVDSVGWQPVTERESIFAMGEGRSEVRLVAWAVTDDQDEDYVVSAFALAPDGTDS